MKVIEVFKGGVKFSARSRGFTLVELMVALVIGLIVIAGAVQVLVLTKRTFNEMEGLGFRQEALRFVSDVVSLDIRTASEVDVLDLNEPTEKEVLEESCAEGNVEKASQVIRMIYSQARNNDPYCTDSASPHLREVWYIPEGHIDDGPASLKRCNACWDGDNDVTYSSPVEEVQDGVFLEFSLTGNAYGVSVTFDDDRRFGPAGQSEEDRSFVFRAINRAKVMDAVRLVPGS